LSLIPLAVSLLQGPNDDDVLQRLVATVEHAPADVQARVARALANLEEGTGSLEDVFQALPDHKLEGALLPRDTWTHWLFALVAGLLYAGFLLALTLEGSAQLRHVLLVGLFTATVGLFLLLALQFVADKTHGVFIMPRGIIGILFLVIQAIGFSYRAAADPSNGFVLSFIGFTLGVGLCEELCKALPLIFKYRQPNDQTWLGAYLWGLGSGAAFGLAEAIIYASDYYNGIDGAGIYLVRYVSCVALHALWTGSAAITIHQRQHIFQQHLAWHDWLARSIFVVAVPALLHGLYDTLLKKEMNAGALGVAALSFVYLAFQISRLRGADDRQAQKEFLQAYQQRRAAL
jgi:RsiW-degrading membrane proteinase PrsW (M82 family)